MVKVYKEIADTTKGKFIPLEKAHLLVSLITGVAESELEKLKVEELVLQEMQAVMSEAPAAGAKEIEEKVYSRLKKRNISLKSITSAKFEAGAPVEAEDLAVEERKIEKDDIKEAMRQVKLKKLMKD